MLNRMYQEASMTKVTTGNSRDIVELNKTYGLKYFGNIKA